MTYATLPCDFSDDVDDIVAGDPVRFVHRKHAGQTGLAPFGAHSIRPLAGAGEAQLGTLPDFH